MSWLTLGHQVTSGIEGEEDEEEESESPQRRASVAEERQRYADDRREAEHHAYVDKDMEEEDREDTISIDTGKGGGLPLGKMDETQDKRQEEHKDTCCSYESLFFAHGAEDEVSVLLRHILELGLRAIEESLALEPSRSDGYLTLVHIVTGSLEVFLESEEHFDTCLLMWLEHVVEGMVGTMKEEQ